MATFEALVFAHPAWMWLAVGASFLTVEVITGSGWLLWPAAAAAAVAIATLIWPLGLTGETAIFAAVTIAATYVGRKFLLGKSAGRDADVNDASARLVGHRGKAVTPFHGGIGRVFVEGKEWSAELEGEATMASGARIEVTAVLGGAKLRVRAAD